MNGSLRRCILGVALISGLLSLRRDLRGSRQALGCQPLPPEVADALEEEGQEEAGEAVEVPVAEPVTGGRVMTGMSFASLEGYRGNRNYIKQHGDFLRSKACWFQHHGYPYLLSVLAAASQPEYKKPGHVQEALRMAPGWLFFLDLDTAIVRPDVPPTHWVDDQFDVIINDHNAALNNGAFLLRAGRGSTAPDIVEHWRRLVDREAPPHRKDWPFTDNGAMIEALISIEPQPRPSRCATVPASGFYSCVHEEMVRQSGQAFDGEVSRNFSGVVKLSAAADGFNNHKCDDQYYSWGWLPGACFHPGRSAVLHTKKFPEPDPGGEDAQCPAGVVLAERVRRPGVIAVLPGHDEPCYLDEPECQDKAMPFLNIERPPEEERQEEQASSA